MPYVAYLEIALVMKSNNPEWRVGQAALNALVEARPELAEKINGGPLDPFHRESRLPRFLAWLRENWDAD